MNSTSTIAPARTALVTGASRGIGRAIAEGLAEAGLDVGLVARDESKLEAVADGVRSHGRTAVVVSADVTAPDAVASAVKAVADGLGSIDLLVNNAGRIDREVPIWEADPEEWWQIVETNVRGPFLFAGYAERPDLTEASFEDGWFDTGDLASLDPDGYVGIRGRTKDVIIRGGENIPVVYVENVLSEHPGIGTVAVVAVSDPRLQERACAVVTLEEGTSGLTLEDLRVFLADQGVAKPYWPERVEVVESLPRTPSGKIQKFRLRRDLEKGAAGRAD